MNRRKRSWFLRLFAAVPTVKDKFTTVIMFRFDTLPCVFEAVDLPRRWRRFGLG
jgi:hypothetical protein